MLVGLCGYIGSGKNAVAEMLVKHHGYEQDSFAKSLKDEYVGELLGSSVVVRTAIFAFTSLATVPSKSVQVSIFSVLLSN